MSVLTSLLIMSLKALCPDSSVLESVKTAPFSISPFISVNFSSIGVNFSLIAFIALLSELTAAAVVSILEETLSISTLIEANIFCFTTSPGIISPSDIM